MVLNDVGPELDPAGIERIRGYAGRTPAVASWTQAIAQVRRVYGSAWPDFSEAGWEKLVRRGYRADARDPQLDADPMIGEPLRNTQAAAPDLWPLWGALANIPVLAIRGAHSEFSVLPRWHVCREPAVPRSPWPTAAMRRCSMNPGAGR